MDDNPAAPKASRSVLYIILAAAGGIALGLAIGLLAGGSGTVTADPSAVVVETGGEESVITPEAAEAAGYIAMPSWRPLAKEEADKLTQGMTPEEVQALFPDLPIVYSTYIHQPETIAPAASSVMGVIGYAPEGQIAVSFLNGELDSWRWMDAPNRWTFVQYPANRSIQAIKEGEGAEQDW